MPTLTYDRLDHPINPQNGGYLQASLAYINSLREGNFLKYELHAKGFITFRKLVTFGVSARVGGSQSFGAASRLPLQERFSLGGSRGVRGFTIDGIGQYNSDGSLKIETREGDSGQINYIKPYGGDQMFTGSLEARFPILRSINLYGSLFYDFGALADEWLEFNRMSIRHSAGLGIRYLLAGMIPIRLDYGFIIDRRCRDVDRQTGACVQKEKVGNLHFGILYTF
jgi:outer membrane protein assembly factor BamA